MSPCSFIPASKRHILMSKTPCRQQTKLCQNTTYLWRYVWPSKAQRFFLSPPTVFHNNWVTFGGMQLSYSPKRYKFSDSVFRSDSDGNSFEYNFFPKYLFTVVKLGTTSTTNFHLSSNVVTPCFLPVEVFLLSLLAHSSICNQVQKENVFMLNAHMCISKRLPEQAG